MELHVMSTVRGKRQLNTYADGVDIATIHLYAVIKLKYIVYISKALKLEMRMYIISYHSD